MKPPLGICLLKMTVRYVWIFWTKDRLRLRCAGVQRCTIRKAALQSGFIKENEYMLTQGIPLPNRKISIRIMKMLSIPGIESVAVPLQLGRKIILLGQKEFSLHRLDRPT
ncbi:MAG: hypothetical protein COA73_11875 [Candidatus Hydrogenedentota bacterium]|nr:MAG: hypothetical protein COA73_11875 [Candidatus Hydrogenedentota bacterium]